jgi:hypothetical protein
MDPDATLEEQRQIAAQIIARCDLDDEISRPQRKKGRTPMSNSNGKHDHQSISGVTFGRYGRSPMRYWDNGFGPLWVYSESLGPLGVVRAQTWEDALECVTDEIMDDADPEDIAEFGNEETGELPECCYWRGSGEPSNPQLTSVIAQSDLNGSCLERLTAEIAKEHRILVRWQE